MEVQNRVPPPPPLSAGLSPRALGGDIPWHGAYGTSLSSSTLFHLELRAEIEARKFFVGEQDPYWARMYREERKGGWELKEKA